MNKHRNREKVSAENSMCRAEIFLEIGGEKRGGFWCEERIVIEFGDGGGGEEGRGGVREAKST